MKKRIMSILLVAVMVLSIMPVSAFATESKTIDVYVTIVDKGNVVIAKELITVTDLDASGDFNVDEVLYSAHEGAYIGGASAGYGTAMGDYGMYITALWGDLSGSYGYWNNNTSVFNLEDAVNEKDYVVAFVYQNTQVWDPYSKFSRDSYTVLSETEFNVTLEKAGYDDNWNTVFAAHKGAIIKVYDADFNELDANDYVFTDNDDGTYSVTVNATGDYTLVAYDNETPIVPAVSALYVTDNVNIVLAEEVEAKINAIGTVTSESENAILEARTAYDGLTDEQKALVGNYDILVNAEKALSEIVSDAEAVSAVEEKIDAIGNVTIISCNKIKEARTAYNALNDVQKDSVKNINVLKNAEIELTKLYVQASNTDHKAIYEETINYTNGVGKPSGISAEGIWRIMGLARAGYSCPKEFYVNIEKYVKTNINEKQQLHRAKSTDNSGVIIALTSAGYDVTNVGGHNLLVGLTDMAYVKKQGINGPIWALMAFDCHNYDIPLNSNATEQVSREKLIEYILEKQLSEGGWALSGDKSDPDITATAIQALAPYYKTNTKVKSAVDKALDCLSSMQQDNGLFSSMDGICSEACAQVVVALTALGINPETDERFIKNGVSVLDAMCLFAVEDGGFSHIFNAELDGMATDQSQYALVAYFRFMEGENSLYDMTDVEIINNEDIPQTGDNNNPYIYVGMMIVALIGISAIAGIKRKSI